jgi:hypothetical protein
MYANKNIDSILEFAQKTLDRTSRINKWKWLPWQQGSHWEIAKIIPSAISI